MLDIVEELEAAFKRVPAPGVNEVVIPLRADLADALVPMLAPPQVKDPATCICGAVEVGMSISPRKSMLTRASCRRLGEIVVVLLKRRMWS